MTRTKNIKPEPKLPPVRLLLIDDNAIFLQTLERFITRDSRLQVIGKATGAEEGLNLAGATQPDIILLDLQMPKVSGLEAIPMLRDRVPSACILVMTLYNEATFARVALKRGAHGFIEKDRMVSDLKHLIYYLYNTRCIGNSEADRTKEEVDGSKKATDRS